VLNRLECYKCKIKFLLRKFQANSTSGREDVGFVCVFFLIYSTISIELTLVWNSVSGVYNVASTGQIIPLVAGLSMLVGTIWELCKLRGWIVIRVS
jgi:hypothetical protein